MNTFWKNTIKAPLTPLNTVLETTEHIMKPVKTP